MTKLEMMIAWKDFLTEITTDFEYYFISDDLEEEIQDCPFVEKAYSLSSSIKSKYEDFLEKIDK